MSTHQANPPSPPHAHPNGPRWTGWLTPAEALARGRAAAERGDARAALGFYNYARRLAPQDGGVRFAIASALLALRDPEAIDAFHALARRYDLREAWMGLAAARRLTGQAPAAGAALAQALHRHAPPRDQATRALCDAIVAAAGAPGWCGLQGDGVLLVSLTAQDAAATPVVLLDGKPVQAAPKERTTRSGTQRLRFVLPKNWRKAALAEVTSQGQALLGSPIAVSQVARVEGFAQVRDGGIEGWAWQPADPDIAPEITIQPAGASGPVQRVIAEQAAEIPHPLPLARPRAFRIAAGDLRNPDGPVDVIGADGRALTGSPVDPGAERRNARAIAALVRRQFAAAKQSGPPPSPLLAGIPAGLPPARAAAAARTPAKGIDIVIPVHGGRAVALACLDSVLATKPPNSRVIVVDDASPDPALCAALDRMAAARRIRLLRLPRNRGFPAAANAGMRLATGRDVVLLNSDTLVPPGWLPRLRRAAYAAPDIGTATPLSNDATILSYPDVTRSNPAPDQDGTTQLDRLAQRALDDAVVDIPTAVGFCMYIRRDCLNDVGLLREDVFAQGYGEENDFCLRARHLGWRHVGAPGIFVAHVGGASFGAARMHLITRNMEILNRLHPGYDALIADFQASDPLFDARRRLDLARWRAGQRISPRREAVVLIAHDRGGGVARRVRERCVALLDEGLLPIVVTPDTDGKCRVQPGHSGDFPNLCFTMPDELPALARLLRSERTRLIELHHFIGHDHALLGLAQRLNVPMDIVVHDYAWFCPRVTLVGESRRYCGEPALAGCETCIADLGGALEEQIGPAALRTRSRADLHRARRVIVPSADAARRIARHFPRVQPDIIPWQDDATLSALPSRPAVGNRAVRVCVAGGISIEKGYEQLLACARDAATRKLPLHFALVGYSWGDARLLDTGTVSITGPYRQDEAVELIRGQRADLGFLPSVWPETWSYVLSELWQAGLPVVAFDLGAPAERIRRSGSGAVLPLGLPASAVNDALLTMARNTTP